MGTEMVWCRTASVLGVIIGNRVDPQPRAGLDARLFEPSRG